MVLVILFAIFSTVVLITAVVSSIKRKRNKKPSRFDYSSQIAPLGVYPVGVVTPGYSIGAVPKRSIVKTENTVETTSSVHSRGSDILTGALLGAAADELLGSLHSDPTPSTSNDFGGFGGGDSGGAGASGSWSDSSSSSSSCDSGSSSSSYDSGSSSCDSGSSSCDSGSF